MVRSRAGPSGETRPDQSEKGGKRTLSFAFCNTQSFPFNISFLKRWTYRTRYLISEFILTVTHLSSLPSPSMSWQDSRTKPADQTWLFLWKRSSKECLSCWLLLSHFTCWCVCQMLSGWANFHHICLSLVIVRILASYSKPLERRT